MTQIAHAALRRKENPYRHTTDLRTVSNIIDRSGQLTVGGHLVHRRTHRCVAFCNAVAALAGIGPVEAR